MKKLLLLSLLATLFAGCRTTPSPESILADQLHNGEGWRKVHAAEGLIESGQLEQFGEIQQLFLKEYGLSVPDSPWRVGCVRVLWQTTPVLRPSLRHDLSAIALNPAALGVAHAVESTGKLKLELLPEELPKFRDYAIADNMLGTYALLILALNNESGAAERLENRLSKGETTAAFAFFYLNSIPEKGIEMLRKGAEAKEHAPIFRAFAFRALARHTQYTNADHVELQERIGRETDPGALRFYLLTVGDFKRISDRTLLESYLTNSNPTLRIAAATSLLRI